MLPSLRYYYPRSLQRWTPAIHVQRLTASHRFTCQKRLYSHQQHRQHHQQHHGAHNPVGSTIISIAHHDGKFRRPLLLSRIMFQPSRLSTSTSSRSYSIFCLPYSSSIEYSPQRRPIHSSSSSLLFVKRASNNNNAAFNNQYQKISGISTTSTTNESSTTAKTILTTNTTTTTITPQHQPPLPIRIALVSTTTALATPSFPALSLLYLLLRISIPDPSIRKSMEGSWGTVVSFCTWTLVPFMYSGGVASLIVPCAIGNGIVAGCVYGVVDYGLRGNGDGGGGVATSSNGSRIMQTPWISGAGIGATVGYIAPKYTYGPIMEHIYGMEGMTSSLEHVLNILPYATEVSVVTGAVAGTILHPLLYYPTHGIPGIDWRYFSGAALAMVSSALYYVYYGQEGVGLPVPEGSFIEVSKLEVVDSILRYNPASGTVDTYSLKSNKFVGEGMEVCLEGRRLADCSRRYAGSKSGTTTKAVFDDRLLAFVYNYWDSNANSRYPDHVVTIKPKRVVQQTQDSMVITDAAVATLLFRDSNGGICNATRDSGNDSIETNGKSQDLNDILTKISDLDKNRIDGKKQSFINFDSMDEVCVAIELLMLLRSTTSSKESPKNNNLHKEAIIPKLESFIRSRLPAITLYTTDEKYSGESVESQLQSAGWNGPELSHAFGQWEHVHKQEVYRTWRNRFVLVATSVILSIGGSLLFSR